MSDLEALTERVRHLLTQRELLVEARHEAHRRRMADRKEWLVNFGNHASDLLSTVIVPRLSHAAGLIDDARLIDHREDLMATLALNQSGRLLARIEMTIAIDGSPETGARVLSLPKLVPILIEFEREDSLALSGDSGDTQRVGQFVDDKIVSIVETVIAVDQDARYHEIVVDPVCRTNLMRDDAVGSVRHGGTTFYFCSGQCRDLFTADPDIHAAPFPSTAWHRVQEHDETTQIIHARTPPDQVARKPRAGQG